MTKTSFKMCMIRYQTRDSLIFEYYNDVLDLGRRQRHDVYLSLHSDKVIFRYSRSVSNFTERQEVKDAVSYTLQAVNWPRAMRSMSKTLYSRVAYSRRLI